MIKLYFIIGIVLTTMYVLWSRSLIKMLKEQKQISEKASAIIDDFKISRAVVMLFLNICFWPICVLLYTISFIAIIINSTFSKNYDSIIKEFDDLKKFLFSFYC